MSESFSDTPLKLTTENNVDELTRAIAALTDGVAKLGAAEEKTQAETKKAADSMDRLKDGLSNVKGGFSDAWEAAETWAGRINAVVDRVTALSSEQERLDANSTRLGLDFDAGAAAAGRFADETEAMNSATRFAAAGIQLSQTELNSLMRVAGATSQMLGITTAQAVDRLTQGIISGAREGLQPFGAELTSLAGGAHTAGERLQALQRVADRTTQATDSAADSVARFRDSLEDMQRTIATSFVREWQRLSDLGAPFRAASTDAEELNRDLQAVGQTAARIASQLGRGVGAVAGGAATLGAWIGEQVGLVDRETTDTLARFTADQARALNAMDDEAQQRTSIGAPTTDPGRVDLNLATPQIVSAVNAENERQRERERNGGRNLRQGGGGQRRDPNEALRARVEAENEILAEDRREQERRAAEEERIAKARSQQEQRDADARRDAMERAQERAAERDRQRGERDFAESDPGLRAANDNARIDRQRTRDLERRRNELRSFTDFFEEQHERQTSAAQQSAEAVTQALGAVGSAYSKHLMALVQGREEGGQALRGFLADTLTSIGQESATKAGFNVAEGIAALATYRYDAAAQHFAAAGVYTVVAAGTGAAGAALAPSAPSASASGASSVASSRGDRTGVAANDNGSGGTTIIEQHFYSPVIGGRDATSAEVGRGMQQFTRAADRRRLGRTGTGP